MSTTSLRGWIYGGLVGTGAAIALSCNSSTGQATSPQPQPPLARAATTAPAGVATIQLNLDHASDVPLPAIRKDLEPIAFGTRDGKEGWVIRLPGNRPIATPAYADGMLFVGGGYGSHEFYGLDAKTGAVVWTYKCEDDGPTAAVVADGCCVFDTESCDEEVVAAKTGKPIWKEWLGDPLMSQPAIANGRIYIAYPGASPHGVQLASGETRTAATAGPAKENGHRLLCQDLKTGKHLWEQDITADVVTAPVVEGDRVYFNCFDGTGFCLNATSGAILWKKDNAGTSAPLVVQNDVIITQKAQAGQNVQEGIRRIDQSSGEAKDKVMLAAGDAAYLRPGASGNSALSKSQEAKLESAVGFAVHEVTSDSPAQQQHLNIGSVAVGWSYQGARAAYAKGNLLNAQGNTLNCVQYKDGAAAWRAEARGKNVNSQVQVFSPPALGEVNLYVCSVSGHLISMRQSDGQVNFMYNLKRPMGFQPTLAEGNIYAGTTDGTVICIKTNDKDADGWYAWGGNAQHNKSR